MAKFRPIWSPCSQLNNERFEEFALAQAQIFSAVLAQWNNQGVLTEGKAQYN